MMTAGMTLTRGLTIPLTVAAGAAIKLGVDFHRQMEFIHTQAGATQHEVDKMTEAVLRLAPATAFGPDELAKALYHIESVGARGAQALNLLKVAAQGAAVGNANLEDTASALAGIMRVYHLHAKQAAFAMGDLNAVVGAGNMRMEDMVNAIQTGLFPTTKGLSISFRETGAALATMTDESVPAQVAATRLRTLFLLMSGETDKSVKTLAKLGIGSLDLAHAMAKPGGMINALTMLKTHLDKVTKDPALQTQFLAKAFGGARSSGTIIQLLNNLDLVKLKFHQINNTAGNFPQAVIATQETSAYKLHQAWAGVQTALVRIGDIIIPIFVGIAEGAAKLARAFMQLDPHMQHLIVYGALIAAALGPTIFIFGALTSAASMLLSPLGLAVAAFVALSYAAHQIHQFGTFLGMIAGAAAGVAAFALAANAASIAETAMLRAMYLLEGAMATNVFFLAAAAIGALIGGLVALALQADNSSGAFKRARAAIDEWTAAANRSHNMSMSLKDAHLAVLTAQDQLARSRQRLTAMERGGHASALDLREAHHAVTGSVLALQHAQERYREQTKTTHVVVKRLKDIHDESVNSVNKLRDHYTRLQREVDHTMASSKNMANQGRIEAVTRDKQRSIVKAYTGELNKLAEHADKVAKANQKAHPQIAAAAAKLRDQAKATAEVAQKLGKIPGEVSKVAGPARAQATALGAGIKSGVLAGVSGLMGALSGAIASAVSAAIAAGQSAAKSHSPSKESHEKIGKPLGQGIVRGFLVGSRDLPDKMKDSVRKALEHAQQVISTRQERLRNAFSRLADYAMRAFDARTQQHLKAMEKNFNDTIARMVEGPRAAALRASEGMRTALTPAEAQLRALQRQHDQAARDEAIASARRALSEAKAGGDPQAILDAQRQLNDALYEDQISHLQDQADAERLAADASAQQREDAINAQYDALQKQLQDQYDEQVLEYQAQRDLQKQHLQDQLDRLQEYLAKHPEAWKKVHNKIMKLFKDAFGPNYQTAGENLGKAFAKGLREADASLSSAARDMAKLIAKYLKLGSPAEAGPLADLDKWWSPFAATLLKGLDTSKINAQINSLASPGASARSRGGDDTAAAIRDLIHAMDLTRPLIGEYHQNQDTDLREVATYLGQKVSRR